MLSLSIVVLYVALVVLGLVFVLRMNRQESFGHHPRGRHRHSTRHDDKSSS